MPPCSSDDDCMSGLLCEVSTGHCEPWTCPDDGDCPALHHCEPGASLSGCVRDVCAADSDCGELGWCVKGACFEEPGECRPDPA